jgi:hypothetical protein
MPKVPNSKVVGMDAAATLELETVMASAPVAMRSWPPMMW